MNPSRQSVGEALARCAAELPALRPLVQRLGAIVDQAPAEAAAHVDVSLAELMGPDDPMALLLLMAQLPPGLLNLGLQTSIGELHWGVDAAPRLRAAGEPFVPLCRIHWPAPESP